ncbi:MULTISPECIES: hypothetical protein [Acidiphilium]|uniref:Lipoprotein n=2 Tax=Acidiphilium TaxID=522 RepID=A0A8G2CLV0_ACIRU|nr:MULTISPECIES: hypothetical protein [Acidiphilium]OYW01666.1 MAG: hypothetical protein B7Z58_10610 [Acidiphilium sp. 37-64-53]OZB30020.1 MAG: hypothetical protein B7X49_04550 [Acidiphilium sp. 34-64-41]SIR09865.1 hypothetical protein SAMN05421828_11561 [Acidiphilium rubrum]HQT83684.1 hypothetical protein [Acidiphilium rubrum]
MTRIMLSILVMITLASCASGGSCDRSDANRTNLNSADGQQQVGTSGAGAVFDIGVAATMYGVCKLSNSAA